MSIEAIREKVMSFVETADASALERLSHFIDTAQAPADWWDDIPQHVRDTLEEGCQESATGQGIPHEEMKKQYPQWFKK